MNRLQSGGRSTFFQRPLPDLVRFPYLGAADRAFKGSSMLMKINEKGTGQKLWARSNQVYPERGFA
jgi:hypothetical protein